MQPGELFVTREEAYKFRKLTPYDRAEAVRIDRDRRRQQLKEELKDAEVGGTERFQTLHDFDETERAKKLGAFFEVFDDPDGKAILFDLSVSDMTLAEVGKPEWKRRADAATCIAYTASLDMPKANVLLAEICNVYLNNEPEDAPEENPIKPATAPVTET